MHVWKRGLASLIVMFQESNNYTFQFDLISKCENSLTGCYLADSNACFQIDLVARWNGTPLTELKNSTYLFICSFGPGQGSATFNT